MWENIGEKIKVLAKVIAWFGIISSIVGGIVLFYIGGKQHYGAGIYIGMGFATIILGSLFSWIASWFMYGFGELIVKTTEIEKNTYSGNTNTGKHSNNKNKEIYSKNITVEKKKHIPEYKKCKKCGQIVDTEIYVSCPNCECEEFIGNDSNRNNDLQINTENNGVKDVIVDNKWICGKCGNANDLFLINCKKCNKEKELDG